MRLFALLFLTACGPSVVTTVMPGDAGGTGRPLDAGPGASGDDAGLESKVDAGDPFDAGSFDAGSSDAGPSGQRDIAQYWGNLQWPPYATLAVGARVTAYGQVWVSGGTEAMGAMAGLEAQLGLGAMGAAPDSWTWADAQFNLNAGNNDEFKAELVASSPGLYQYGFRYRVRGSSFVGKGEWLYSGLMGPGLADSSAGVLAVKDPSATLKVATQNLACVRDDVQARLAAMADRWAAMQVDLIALQEVCEQAPTGNTAGQLAANLATRTGRPWKHVYVQTHQANNTTPEGLGILTPLPVVATDNALLPTQEFPRRALLAMVATPVGMVAAVSTHFSFRPQDGAFRLQQAQAALALGAGWQTGPAHPPGSALFVAGDFNAIPGSGVPELFTQAGLTDAWASTHPGAAGFSFPSNAPNERIDYLMVRGLAVASASEEFLQPYSGSSYVSDHAGFGAVFR
jgi:endonuclease/exonuclease/phosphatase family metal-dependent hydrolase